MRGLIDYLRLQFHRRFYSEKQIKKYQLKELKKLVSYAKKYSPFYKDLYKGMEIDSLADFQKLPIINKKIMMKNFSSLNTCKLDKDDVVKYAVNKENNKDFYGYYQNKYVVGLSSGTSGNKGIFITPKALTKRLPFVFLARGGLRLKNLPFRILFMLRVFSQGFDDINAPFIKLKYLSTMTEPEKIVKKINEDIINILMAPPSLIRQLLPFVKTINVKLKQIVTYAEVLYGDEKSRFEKAFDTSVVEIYQASEGQVASACKHGHLHINEDMVYIELYDKEDNLITEDSIVGQKMILTNLVNKAQPLIRYEMNDMVVLDKKCTCGSNFRRIKKVLGRHDDLLYFTDKFGKEKIIYPDLFVRWIIVTSDLIKEFQVLQPAVNQLEIVVDIIKDKDSVIDSLRKKLIYELEDLGIDNTFITFSTKEIKLPEDKNKFKRFISNI